jgi:hypothetical protein
MLGSGQTKQYARQVKNKFKSMLIIFFYINGIVHKEFVPTDQRVNFADLRRLRENVRRLRHELWRQKNLLFLCNAPFQTSFFVWEFLTKSNTSVVPHLPYFFPFLQLKVKLVGRHLG